jgi:hypothetical protein
MTTKINPDLITDDMMYEGNIQPIDLVLYSESKKKISTVEQIREDQLWGEIRRAAKTNSALQSVLERAIIIYQLSKNHGTK